MFTVDLCSICGNKHSGACSAQPTYFYWYPDNISKPPNYVQIVGQWHLWQMHERLGREVDDTGEVFFETQINVPVGTYQYKYIVDGEWKHNPNAPKIPDAYNSYNNVIEIFPRKTYLEYIPKHNIKITSRLAVDGLKILGSWDDWQQQEMKKTYNNLKGCQENVIYLELASNQSYEFIFKLGKQYLIEEKYPTVSNQYGGQNNHIIVYSDRISTPTGWRAPKHSMGVVVNCKSFGWERISMESDLPYDRIQGHSMCHIGEHIYVFGGKTRAEFIHTLAKINVHNFNNNTFEEVLPNARAFHTMVTYGNKIIIYGGHNNSILQDYYAFNTTEGIWQSSPEIHGQVPQKREKQSCVLYEMLLVFFGGYFCSPDLEHEFFFNDLTVLDLEKMQWISRQAIHIRGQLPEGRFSHSATMVYSDMYIFGGMYNASDNLNLNDLWKINLQTVNNLFWEKVEPKGKSPVARHGHTKVCLNNFLIIFGGRGDNDVYLNDVVVFDTTKLEWIYPLISGEKPQPRYNHAATVVNNDHIVIFGGRLKDKKRNKYLHLLKPKDFKPSLDIEQEDDEDKDKGETQR